MPHVPGEEARERICELFPGVTMFEDSTPDTLGIILVNQLGTLLRLYSIADAAFVGGGFGAGVHSVTEPAGYGMPIACGQQYRSICRRNGINKARYMYRSKHTN